MPSPSLRLFSTPEPHPRGYRFGPFELEIRAGELRKNGVRIRVRKQSVQILVMLLEQPGEVVLREEIRQKLWPDDTVVEFDHSINTAIQRLRDVLMDSSDKPRYIETLARRGYRFIETVELLDWQRPHATVERPTLERSTADLPAVMRRETPRWRRSLILQIVAVAGLGAVALAGWMRPVSKEPPRNWVFPLGNMGFAVPSPDGASILYRYPNGLFLRQLDSNVETELNSPARLNDNPIWSPDGSQVLFQTLAGLIRTPLPHGPPVNIWPGLHITRGYSWGPQGAFLVAVADADGVGCLYLISPDGSPPAQLDIPQLKDGLFYEPEFLPGGDKFLFTWAAEGDHEAGIYLATLRRGKVVDGPLLLRRNITAGHFANSDGDKLLYVQNNSLYAQALNSRRGTLEGEPRRIVENVLSILEMRHAYFAVSRSGSLAWRSGKAAAAQLTWFDRSGKALGAAGPPCEPSAILLSPDENHLLLTIGDHFGGILDAHQTSYTQLPGFVKGLWTLDNAHILYHSRGSGRLMERDLARNTDREVARLPGAKRLWALSPDGKVLLYSGNGKINAVHLEGPPGRLQPEVALTEEGMHVGFSPDGRWIVYSNYVPTVGRREVFVKSFAFAGLSKQISVDGGTAPVWRRDGREILYTFRGKIYAVRVSAGRNQISASQPEPLFDVRVPPGLTGDSIPLAVVHDGSRILFPQSIEGTDPRMSYMMSAWHRATLR